MARSWYGILSSRSHSSADRATASKTMKELLTLAENHPTFYTRLANVRLFDILVRDAPSLGSFNVRVNIYCFRPVFAQLPRDIHHSQHGARAPKVGIWHTRTSCAWVPHFSRSSREVGNYSQLVTCSTKL